jgi:hypothetical protein
MILNRPSQISPLELQASKCLGATLNLKKYLQSPQQDLFYPILIQEEIQIQWKCAVHPITWNKREFRRFKSKDLLTCILQRKLWVRIRIWNLHFNKLHRWQLQTQKRAAKQAESSWGLVSKMMKKKSQNKIKTTQSIFHTIKSKGHWRKRGKRGSYLQAMTRGRNHFG